MFNFTNFFKIMVLTSAPAILLSFSNLGFSEGMVSLFWGGASICVLYLIILSAKSLDDVEPIKLTNGKRLSLGILVFFITMVSVSAITFAVIKEEYLESDGVNLILGLSCIAISIWLYRALVLSTGISVLKTNEIQTDES